VALKLIDPPTTEPVTLAEAKAQCRVDIADDDTLITGLISAARTTVEDMAHRALVSQCWRLSLGRWPAVDYISLPLPPLQEVDSIIYTDQDGNETTWAAANYIVDDISEPGRIVLAHGANWPGATLAPANAIEIDFVAGYGSASDVPAVWKQAILLLIGHWYENREAALVGPIAREIPMGVKSLVWLNRG
jgi:uncharacterized phiE125 gp8 family phage protein